MTGHLKNVWWLGYGQFVSETLDTMMAMSLERIASVRQHWQDIYRCLLMTGILWQRLNVFPQTVQSFDGVEGETK